MSVNAAIRWGVVGMAMTACCLAWPAPVRAQLGDKLLLTVDSQVKLAPAVPGQASWEQTVVGEAWLNAKAGGKFSGQGELTVHSQMVHSPSPYFRFTPMQGKGAFRVDAVREGNKLRFCFEHGAIPVEGTLIVSMPHVSKTEPTVQQFDPNTLAGGDLESKAGVTIEMRDGATATIEVPGAAKTTFTLYGVEVWRVSVAGVETDNTRPFIQNPKLTGPAKELPIAMRFQWNLVGDIVLTGKGGNRAYLRGEVFSASVEDQFQFENWDLYECRLVACPGADLPDVLVGQPLPGAVSGAAVRLKWPTYFPAECVVCIPKKSYLGKIPYRQTFGTKEFTETISREQLPLVDGAVVKGAVQDWMQYTITMTRLD